MKTLQPHADGLQTIRKFCITNDEFCIGNDVMFALKMTSFAFIGNDGRGTDHAPVLLCR